MNRFKVSKYRSAFPHVFKKECWIHDLSVGSDPRQFSSSSLIKASCQNVAFISDFKNTGSVSVLPLGSSGRNTSFPKVSGHSGFVTDFDLSIFDDSLLCTGAEDGMVKMWNVSDKTLLSSLGPFEGSIETVHFHPQAENILAVSQQTAIRVLDTSHQDEVFSSTNQKDIQCFCWSGDGTMIGVISKGDKKKRICIYDPRQSQCAEEANLHTHHKGSSITWMGGSNKFVTTGFNQSRGAEIALWSLENMTKPIYSSSLRGGNGSGVPLTFYDDDTSMLYAGIKGETSISFFELQDKDPCLSLGPNAYNGSIQIKGMCLIPKRAVDVMKCELARVLVLSQNSIIPISFCVQRKSYAEFHADLYPDTWGPLPAASSDEWVSGSAAQRSRISLDPSKLAVKNKESMKKEKSDAVVTEARVKLSDNKKSDLNSDTSEAVKQEPSSRKLFNLVRSSKVRYIEGKILHKDRSVQNLPKLSSSIPGDSNAFSANKDRFAFGLFGPGGQIGVYALKNTGRLDPKKMIKLENVNNVMDFSFDPFDPLRIAVGLDDALIKVWNIPDDNDEDVLTVPSCKLKGHYEKITAVAFHPQAKDILASSSYDCKIIIWNLSTQSSAIVLGPLPEVGHALSWSTNGKELGMLSQNHSLLVFDPRVTLSPVKEGKGPDGSRASHLIWLDEDFILTTGFDRTHSRIVCLYSSHDLSRCLSVLSFDTNPSILTPFYDPDIHVIFLTGKGDSVILTVEFDRSQEPFLFQTASFSCPSPHQGVMFLQKTLCDVECVQVEYGVRLCVSSLEPFVFKVPRVKVEYFQDDLFPSTLNWWESAVSSSEWLSGINKIQGKITLCPSGMKPLSEAPQQNTAPKKYASYNPREKTDEEKKEELITAMMGKMGEHEEEKLPQDEMEGVDSDEWDD